MTPVYYRLDPVSVKAGLVIELTLMFTNSVNSVQSRTAIIVTKHIIMTVKQKAVSRYVYTRKYIFTDFCRS